MRSLLGTKFIDIGYLYENFVAFEFLRRGYEVYVGKFYDKEIDFVSIKNGNKVYVQVFSDISNEETIKREVSPLLSINDGYKKIMIARTKVEPMKFKGIDIVDIGRWLLDK